MFPPDTLGRDSTAGTRHSLRRRGFILRRFRRNEEGATAVEFGMIALPFFALLFAIMETALAFWSTQVLETAVADASRLVYTGQFQNDNGGKSAADLAKEFQRAVCNNVKGLFDCGSMVKVDIRTYTSFPGGVPQPVNNGAFDTSGFGYQPPGPNQIVVVRAAMEYPVFVSLMNSGQTNLTNGKRLIMASATFRTEPYQ
jgi:Flp pilus assembly protein TadG